MDHPGSHRDSVLLTDVLAKSNLVQGAQGSHGHGQVDTLSRDVLQGPDVYELNRIFAKPNQISPTQSWEWRKALNTSVKGGKKPNWPPC